MERKDVSPGPPLGPATRDLLYLTAQPLKWLVDGLLRVGWRPVVAEEPQKARDLSGRHDISVGLLDIVDQASALRLLPKVMEVADCDIQWIALVPKHALPAREIRSSISRLCYDYCTLPVPLDRLAVTLGRAYGMAQLRRTLSVPPETSQPRYGIIGVSERMEAVWRSIETFAACDAPVLITGETGTGKERAASAIHGLSRRSRGPLIPVNCGALPTSLVQSELFGYERGAFTGAERRTIGKFEAANHGTIFLDEVGELPPPLQANLLRFLQENRIQRVGGHDEIELDIRVVAATNVDLLRAMEGGRFREDLFYRLSVLVLELPPLRDRISDIDLIAHHVFRQHIREKLSHVAGFSEGALAAMRSHRWPGNVRELINRVRRALVTCQGKLINAEDLGLGRCVNNHHSETLLEARSRADRDALQRTFLQTSGNMSETARRLAVTRSTLYRLMHKHHLTSLVARGQDDGPIHLKDSGDDR